jgi:butyryl-CoA dehydrogenase
MDFELTSEQRALREAVRDFANEVITPGAKERDHSHEFPMDIFMQMGELGFLGVPYPEKYGGAGFDTLSYAITMEEIARVDGSLALGLAAHISLGSGPLYYFGNEEQKQKYLVPLASGKAIGAFGLTEPGAGSDAGGTRTVARLDGDEWVINGSKIYCTNGRIARTTVITARTDRGNGESSGISSFIVENGTSGYTYGKDEDKMGLRSSVTSPLFFADCRIPYENLLGKEGAGFKQFLAILDGGRISIGAMAVGLAQAALEASLKYSQQREQFNQPISNFQAIQFKLADMATQIDAARLLVWRAAWLKDSHQEFGNAAAMGKLFASEIAERACHQAIQIHGGMGYTTEMPVERYYRDVRLTEIGEGTSEIQRIVIARHLLREAKTSM